MERGGGLKVAYWSSSIRASGVRCLGISWAMSRKRFRYQARTSRSSSTGEDLRDTTVVGGCSSVWEIADLSGGTWHGGGNWRAKGPSPGGILGLGNLHAAVQLRRPARRYRLDELLTTCEETKLSARCRKSAKDGISRFGRLNALAGSE